MCITLLNYLTTKIALIFKENVITSTTCLSLSVYKMEGVDISLKLFKFGGLHPKTNTIFDKLRLAISSAIVIMMFVLTTIGFYIERKNIEMLSKYFESFFINLQVNIFVSFFLIKSFIKPHFQCIIKVTTMFYYRKDLKIILDEIKNHFRDSNLFSPNVRKYDRIIRKALKIYCGFIFVTFVMRIILPLFPGTPYIFEIWIPDIPYVNFQIIYFIELYLILFFVSSIIAFDILLMSLCAGTLTQFRMVNKIFSEIDFRKIYEGNSKERKTLVSCIKQHDFLTR